jgi:predicted nucleotidyltransferase
MNLIEAALRRAADDLAQQGRTWALIGGFAVSARTEPRFTRDVDIAVAVDDDEAAESLVRALMVGGYRLLASVEQDAAGRLATVRLGCPVPGAGEVVVDLLFASAGIEPEIAEGAEAIEVVPGLRLPVARVGHLIALKLLARDDDLRPQDRADLHALGTVATTTDVKDARTAIELIMRRGFDRGRDLLMALDAWVHASR